MKNSKLLQVIIDRGTENVIPSKEALLKLLASGKKLNIYLGIDPTATHIHLGHAVPLRKLQAFAELGHNVYFLIGDFTALIGDTSDKDTERPVLTTGQIKINFETYKEQAQKVLDFSKIKVVYNSDWLKKLKFEDIVKLCQRFSAGDFTSRELIKKRLVDGKHVGLHELLYPVMQGYDSYHLNTDIQLGGTDQTFNMQAGRSLVKDLLNKDSFVLANGFLPGTDGRKMSKSWGNAIWLDDSPEDIYSKIMSLKDELIKDYFALATSLPLEEIETIIADHIDDPMNLKKELAHKIVSELCGKSAANQASELFKKTVQEKESPKDVQIIEVESDSLDVNELIRLLVDAKIIKSNSEGKRLFKQNSLYIENKTINKQIITLNTINNIRVGKRKYLQIIVK